MDVSHHPQKPLTYKTVANSRTEKRHTVEGSTNCYDGNAWDESICTDGETCAEKCCVDGGDYEGTYGIKSSGDELSLQFVTKHEFGTNVGSRVYLMEDEENYQMFDLLGNEFTFDVDVSNIGCGLNGALYFVTVGFLLSPLPPCPQVPS